MAVERYELKWIGVNNCRYFDGEWIELEGESKTKYTAVVEKVGLCTCVLVHHRALDAKRVWHRLAEAGQYHCS